VVGPGEQVVTRRTMLGALAGAAVLAGTPRFTRGPLLVPRGTGPSLPSSPFTLGVASGDPLPDGIVLWTRLVVDPDAPDGGVGPNPIRVQWELAADERFRRNVHKGTASADPDDAHSVHVDVRGLDPGRDWFYRFRVGDHESPIGRTRTAPAADQRAQRLVFGVASCQQYYRGYFTAHQHMAQEDLDAVLFLGDYIYEGGSTAVRAHEGPEPMDLVAYRRRYVTYKSDVDLQAAHLSCPWVVTWDDHEVENNYADDVAEDPAVTPEQFRARRALAYRAWWEHQPVRLPRPTGPDYRIHRSVRFGRLAEVQVLDTRQYRSPQCDVASDLGARCESALAPDTTMLGAEQERWLLRRLGRSRATWNVLAQQVLMAQMNFAAPSPDGIYTLDSWDGYTAARTRLLDGLSKRRVANPVVVTGDIHSAWVNDLKADFLDPESATVGTELVGTSVTSLFPVPSSVLGNAVAAQPHLKYFEGDRRGYLLCTLDARELRADHRFVSTTAEPVATVETGASFVIEAGQPGAHAA
jgi:alkaline phosphatase D